MSPPNAEGGPTAERVREALTAVVDPEVEMDIVSLGLVYGIEVRGGDVTVTFTLTTPGCPLRTVITECVAAAVYALPGVENVHTDLVWEPRWHPGMMENT
ncbi:MAG: metal-sulfur cluster assembly factor [Longimicrobiales bacterium]|nr:metal-sulfur cluster assembly factor [Longimicrobiales bacterium]